MTFPPFPRYFFGFSHPGDRYVLIFKKEAPVSPVGHRFIKAEGVRTDTGEIQFTLVGFTLSLLSLTSYPSSFSFLTAYSMDIQVQYQMQNP